MNQESIREFAQLTQTQNIELVATICQENNWNKKELIDNIINTTKMKEYKNLFYNVVEDNINKSIQNMNIENNQGDKIIPIVDSNKLYYYHPISYKLYDNNYNEVGRYDNNEIKLHE